MFVQAQGVRHHMMLANRHGECTTVDTDQPVVVMVHGALNDTFASFYLSLHWPLAQLGMTNIMYDRRGHGRTEYVPCTLTLQQASTDLQSMLDAVGAHRPVHLIGNSLGANVAVDFAVHYPNRVASLVMLEGEPPTAAWRISMLEGMMRGLDETDPKRRELLGTGKRTRHQRRTQACLRLLDETTMFRDIGASRVVDAPMLATLDLPILGIYGDQSGVGAQQRAEHALRNTPRVELHTVAGAGHLLLFDATREVVERLGMFYRKHEPRCLPCELPR
jgi:pimeloyl-ACP methyl ester carboxylesterase